MAIPTEITGEDVLAALERIPDGGTVAPLGKSRDYDLVHERIRYAPKAVVGLVARRALGRDMTPDEFSGGESAGQANAILRNLGFVVIAKGAVGPGEDWTVDEQRTAVIAHLGMLRAELEGLPIVNRHFVREMIDTLPARNRRAIEFRFDNIRRGLASCA